jgi:DNA helicase HerA-like ATPase
MSIDVMPTEIQAVIPAVIPPPPELVERLQSDIDGWGKQVLPDPAREGSVGSTMFDLPGSQDTTVTVLLPQDKAREAPSQSLVRIKSRTGGDGKTYLGMVTAGPFIEPDTLRADSHLLVTVTTQGGVFLPPAHGRIQVTLLGEELPDGTLVPPRLRPLPNSPVFTLNDAEAGRVLKATGDLRLGLAVGYRDVVVGIPSNVKSVLPRHTAILGTTGGGKSTTVSGLVQQAQAAGMAVLLLDVEGEYVHLHEPTDDRRMRTALAERGLKPAGIPARAMTLYHLAGRQTANRAHPQRTEFSVQFARLSPYAAMEVLNLPEAQQQRFLAAYDLTREVMRDLGIFPSKGNKEEQRFVLELDEFERGYPRLTLSLLIDVVRACLALADRPPKDTRGRPARKEEEEIAPLPIDPQHPALKTPEGKRSLQVRLNAATSLPGNSISWRALLGKLARLHRLKVFYDEGAGVKPLSYEKLLQPGQVSVVDLSDSGASEMNNLVIADLLHGVLEAQDRAWRTYEQARTQGKAPKPPARVLVVIEEAHEFLSAERLDRMRNLFEQVARIARRGRKRWLGLAFVTQLPQHLPRELLGLCNGYILHKITDEQVVSALRRTVSGIDESLWARLPGLAPGQAIVSFPHLARPLLVAVDPAPAKLRLTD